VFNVADLPADALREAAAAYSCAYTSGVPHEELARVAVEAAAPILEAHVRADERRKVAEEFHALASRCRAIPDKGLNLGQIWQRDEAYWRVWAARIARQTGEALDPR
jgi:hypothetical protein